MNSKYGNTAPPAYPFTTVSAPENYNNQQNNQNSQNPQNQWDNMPGLTGKVTRIKFIRKVYLILTAQLVFTFGVVSIFVFSDSVRTWAKTPAGRALYFVSMILFFALIITFSIMQCCNSKFLRKVPYNYILLIAITVTMTLMLGMISAYNSIQAVLIAIGVTLTVTVGVSLFAMQTKYDFTNCWLLMLCLSLALLGFGIATAICYSKIPVLQAVYGGLGAVLMAMFLAIDTQMLMGNKKYAFNPEDYINATVQLYLDICYMFIYLLQLTGFKN